MLSNEIKEQIKTLKESDREPGINESVRDGIVIVLEKLVPKIEEQEEKHQNLKEEIKRRLHLDILTKEKELSVLKIESEMLKKW